MRAFFPNMGLSFQKRSVFPVYGPGKGPSGPIIPSVYVDGKTTGAGAADRYRQRPSADRRGGSAGATTITA